MLVGRIVLLLLGVVLVGCLEEPITIDSENGYVTISTEGDVLQTYRRSKLYMFGDSLCAPEVGTTTTIGYKELELDCLPGRKLTHFPYVPPDAKFLILSGGTNDASWGGEIEFFEERLLHYTQHPYIDVVCILPNILPPEKPSSVPFREIMMTHCMDYIDPVPDCGVQILHTDGIHYYQSDRDSLGQCIEDKLYQYGVLSAPI